MKRICVILTMLGWGVSAGLAQPKNIILFIGDGMGPEQVKAGRLSQGSPLSFEGFPHHAMITTHSADNAVTDSAASATAMATGEKVNNEVISKKLPGDGSDLLTILERSQGLGKSVGLVTTSFITDATPAAFAAHTDKRDKRNDIAVDYLNSKPNLMLGGIKEIQNHDAVSAGYEVITTRAVLAALETETAGDMIFGQFGVVGEGIPYEADGETAFATAPHLSEMTEKALNILDNDPDGFFLMVEGAKIDWAGHGNLTAEMVHEVVEFSVSVQKAIDWANGRTDTLILVTADHETGGLTVTPDIDDGVLPSVTWNGVGYDINWSTTGHTATQVDLYAWGPNSELVTGTLDNTYIHTIMTTVPTPTSSGVDLRAYAAAGGTYVEFVAYDVESDGEVKLALMGERGEVVWTGSVDVEAGPRRFARFLVPELEAGGTYDFQVRDEVGKYWTASGVVVGDFSAAMTRLTRSGVTLSFESLLNRRYDIEWCEKMGAAWKTVETVTATSPRTSVVVEYPDANEPCGFFRVRLK